MAVSFQSLFPNASIARSTLTRLGISSSVIFAMMDVARTASSSVISTSSPAAWRSSSPVPTTVPKLLVVSARSCKSVTLAEQMSLAYCNKVTMTLGSMGSGTLQPITRHLSLIASLRFVPGFSATRVRIPRSWKSASCIPATSSSSSSSLVSLSTCIGPFRYSSACAMIETAVGWTRVSFPGSALSTAVSLLALKTSAS